MFSLLWHGFSGHETHPVQTTHTVQPRACNRTQLLAVTLSNSAYSSSTNRGEFHSGQHNFLVPQVSLLPSNCHVCLLQDTDNKLQVCVLKEAGNRPHHVSFTGIILFCSCHELLPSAVQH